MGSRFVQVALAVVAIMVLAIPSFADSGAIVADYATAATTVQAQALSALTSSWPIFAGIVAAMVGLHFLKRVVHSGG